MHECDMFGSNGDGDHIQTGSDQGCGVTKTIALTISTNTAIHECFLFITDLTDIIFENSMRVSYIAGSRDSTIEIALSFILTEIS